MVVFEKVSDSNHGTDDDGSWNRTRRALHEKRIYLVIEREFWHEDGAGWTVKIYLADATATKPSPSLLLVDMGGGSDGGGSDADIIVAIEGITAQQIARVTGATR